MDLFRYIGVVIGVDLFRYITIAVDAFDDICQQYFLLCYKIMVVKLPDNDVRYQMKINWLN